MPGLVGFVGDFDPDSAKKLLEDMVQAMKDKDWYQADLHTGNGFGLGRASLDFLNPGSQPIWNEDRTLCIVMEGELYDYKDLKQDLIDRGHRFASDNDAEFVIHLFEEFGEEFATYLNGAFVAAIWNQHTRKLMLVNDRLGLRPLYYAWHNGCFTFASGIRALLADPALSHTVDPVAIAQALSFEYLLGDRTLLNEVKLLPPASLLIFRSASISTRSYWEAKFADVYQLRNREEYLEGLIYYLRQAIARQSPGDLSAGVNLSGGLDSRMLVGLLSDGNINNPLHTFTFGIPGCDDARLARKVASVVRTQHQFLELNPGYLSELGEEGVRLIDGLGSCVHMHAFSILRTQAKYVHVLYTGFLIDSLISPDLKREWLGNYDDDTVNKLLFDDINYFHNIRKEEIFTEPFQRQIKGTFEDSFRACVAEARATSFADWQNNFEIRQRLRRFTQNGDELLRSQVICRTPFCDNDLVEFCLSLPPGLRLDRFLFKEALARSYHALAKIPWTKTGFPIVPCFQELGLRIDQQIRWHLRSVGLKRIPAWKPFRPYADYDTWMRSTLRSWVEEILLSKHALERGYFDPTYVKKLVTSQMAGENHSRELGMLLTLELWHRQFID